MNKNNLQKDKIMKDRSNSFLAYIGNAAEEELLKEFDQWENNATDITIPEELETKILKSAGSFNKKEKNGRRKRTFLRISKTAAIVILLISVAFSTLMISVDAFRVRVIDFLFEDKGSYMEVIPLETEENTLEIKNGLPSDGQGVFYLRYIPEGFKIVETKIAGSKKIITFQDNVQKILIFTQEPWDNGKLFIDNEDIESGQILINEEAAFWTSKNDMLSLVWNKNNYRFMLFGPIELEEMIIIAENIFFIK